MNQSVRPAGADETIFPGRRGAQTKTASDARQKKCLDPLEEILEGPGGGRIQDKFPYF